MEKMEKELKQKMEMEMENELEGSARVKQNTRKSSK